MSFDEKKISNLIATQFPEIYRIEGENFIDFVKTYYEWLESSDNTIYHTRRLLDYKDIDTTTNDFLVHFKEKYLQNIQFNTATNTKQLVKHSLDLYRSRGTPRAIDLFFKIVFGEESEVYYPGQDVFRSSDSEWVLPKYLEVVPREENKKFVNKQIIGLNSGATAFVEAVVTRKIDSKFIDVFYISAINKDFETGETIALTVDPGQIEVNPIITGSLTELVVLNGGEGFSVGEIVNVTHPDGSQATARVTSLKSITGTVDFNLVDGGWGYSNSSVVLVSDKVLRLSNVQTTYVPDDFTYTLQSIVQPLANIHYEYLSNSVSVGANVYTYSGSTISGVGRVLATSETNSTSGYWTVSILSGNLQSNSVYYTLGNSATANLVTSGYADITANSTIVGLSPNVAISYQGSNGSFAIGAEVYQLNQNSGAEIANAIISSVSQLGTNGVIYVTNAIGLFVTSNSISVRGSNVGATITSLGFDVGVAETVNAHNGNFVSLAGNYIYEPTYNINGTVDLVTAGSGADFTIGTPLTYTEAVNIYDLIFPEKDTALNAADYGANLNFANSSTTLSVALTPTAKTIGTIAVLANVNPGINYNYAPYVAVYEKDTFVYKKRDFSMEISNTDGSFIVGELVTQNSTGGSGIITFANDTIAHVKRITFEDKFAVNTSNSSYLLVGSTSSATAKIQSISPRKSKYAGLNDTILTEVATSAGSVATMQVIDSGFGYISGENVTFTSKDGLRSGTAKGFSRKQGTGTGYYRTNNGFLSNNKYLYDGDYYQDFSYVINTAITYDRYADMLRKILHVAGTKAFAGIIKKSLVSAPLDGGISELTIANSTSSNTRYYT